MAEITLESIAQRLDVIERRLRVLDNPDIIPAKRDWRTVVGKMEDNEFTRQWIAEMEAIREADRAAARAEPEE